mmetsp:Transcript_3685/g.6463  ORF Transcript_3685/g.6463 Transcript_3685/m.6463 type:complete len:84 (-) Transcript_3685:888-1139(-)
MVAQTEQGTTSHETSNSFIPHPTAAPPHLLPHHDWLRAHEVPVPPPLDDLLGLLQRLPQHTHIAPKLRQPEPASLPLPLAPTC